MIIKILGTGCSNCRTLESHTKQAVAELGNAIEVVKEENITKILEYKVMRTPALVFDEKVVMSGKVLSVPEIKNLIHQYFEPSI
ncbi:MAG: thioredoxin family protein [Bacteroidota bacterium]|nr:thioredoxin family protein [Bacteroidota bacterium]